MKRCMVAVLPRDRWRSDTSASFMRKPILKALALLPSITVPPKVESTPPPGAAALSTEDLLVELARRLAKLLDAPAQEGKPLVTSFPKRKHNPFMDISPRRPTLDRVLVIGPLKGQQKEIMAAHGEWIDLRFVASEESPALVGEVGRAADHVVLWTNFISHSHQEQAKKLSAKLHYVTGGMSALHDKLRELC
jgi:hypothetical protein